MKKHTSFEEMLSDAGQILPKRSTKDVAEDLMNSDISGYDRKLITNTVNEMLATAKMLKDIRTVPKITVFGSARTKPDHPDYILCKNFSKQVADLGYMIITGAGPGIMAAAPEGAGAKNSIGVSIELPFEEGVNEFVKQSDYLITYKYFFTRKLTFVREADAVVLFPGGFGTMDEAFEALCLLHTGRSMPVPFVLMENEDGTYWERWMKYVQEGLLETGNISDSDMFIFRRFSDPTEAADYIHNFYRRYHSMRYVEDKVIIRLNTPVPQKLLDDLSTEYAEFLGEFGIQKCDAALPEEADEPDLAHLPRLVLKANTKRPVDLYCFVRSLNRELLASSTSKQAQQCKLPPHPNHNPRPKREKVYNK